MAAVSLTVSKNVIKFLLRTFFSLASDMSVYKDIAIFTDFDGTRKTTEFSRLGTKWEVR